MVLGKEMRETGRQRRGSQPRDQKVSYTNFSSSQGRIKLKPPLGKEDINSPISLSHLKPFER